MGGDIFLIDNMEGGDREPILKIKKVHSLTRDKYTHILNIYVPALT